ncbi:GPW/gp25 family protein [Pseudomonas fluorescens BRIP34879]|uniref:type VI secretion system baseplate subunit TssE n=1 Tax=Pseudomonas poae TaxID=200451 RepID=UPI0002A78E3D|nr:type VI secretion system baseplate subunit TssE [Pseudomonas poae]ELQ15569.1 GPW/gp25 family protein [Pseudomonas fluorescens BRIP34879]MBC3198625.1 type VI secretion system baseplate subunit TssE [Pseudomonas poae]
MTCHHSLFERLEGHAYARSGGMASVAAHLGKMLSTRAGSVQTAGDYGLPDLNDMRQSLHESLSQSRLSIERFIQAYEPRLTNVRVRALPRDRDPLVLAFSIAAMLVIDGEARAVAFSAHLGGGGQVEVAPDDL